MCYVPGSVSNALSTNITVNDCGAICLNFELWLATLLEWRYIVHNAHLLAYKSVPMLH